MNDPEQAQWIKLLEHFSYLVDEWMQSPKTPMERMEALVFSVCSTLDGCVDSIPPVGTIANMPMLHEYWYDIRRATKQRKTDKELFHSLWTKAVGTKDYNKAEWQEAAKRFINESINHHLHFHLNCCHNRCCCLFHYS